MFLKNVASQKIAVFAWDWVNNEAATGIAAYIDGYISKDGGASAATNDANPTELDATYMPGIYLFDMTQTETNCDLLILSCDVPAGIHVEPVIIHPHDQAEITDATDAILLDTGTDGVVLSTATVNAIADAIIQRDFAESDGYAAVHSIYTALMMKLESALSGSTLTVYETDGTTSHTTRTVTTDASANPITAIT